MKKLKKLLKGVFLVFSFILMMIIFPVVSSAGININTPSWEKVKIYGKENKYVFLFISESKSDENKKIEIILQEINSELRNKSAIVKVVITDKKEEELIKFFRIAKENVPIVLVIAPNGAITGAFSKQVEKKSLREAIVSTRESEIILSLQERCLVFICFYKNKNSFLETVKSDLKTIEKYFKGSLVTFYISSN
ncbi:MAG TPA: hypothetical protein DHV62_06580, partial [Elusimicrobia bacterium]|nr:hypothetical protein [Elusimicrobiota bacterium]